MLSRKLYYLHWLLKSERWPQKKIEKFQLKRLKWIVNYCYRNIRFYRKVWKENDSPKKINCLKDIEKFPIINRKMVMENYSDFIVNYPKKNIFDEKIYYTGLTSGSSSGHSFRTLINEKTWDLYEAIYLRGLVSIGYSPLKKMSYYWYESYKKWYHKIRIMRKDFILPSTPVEKQIELIEKFDNPYVYYFPSILYILTKINPQFKTRPKAVITHAEVISKKMRKRIENAFDSKVYDQYGTTEFNEIGWGCEENLGYHINSEALILEVIKNNEKVFGEMGDIIISDLWNTTFPLIRYSIGDAGMIAHEKCSCGRGLPLLKSVEGRRTDIFHINKRTITPKVIIDSLDELPLKKFDFNKIRKDEFLLNFVPLNEHIKKEKIAKDIRNKLFITLGKNINLRVQMNDTLILRRGKFKMVNNQTKQGLNDIIKLDPFSEK